MPAIFVGHGNPMNAVRENVYTRAWTEIGRNLPRPQAIVAVSAHWYMPGTAVTISTSPRTVHDFGGFPPELYKVLYPAPGGPMLAARLQKLLAPVPVTLDDRWGLDHGTWAVLRHMYPGADVPVVQLSIDETQPASFHHAIGERIAPLREEGILIVGSGNLVHNMHTYAWGAHDLEAYDWARIFEERARQLLSAAEHAPLINYEKLGREAMLSVPTPDHYLPLLYVIGAQISNDEVSYPVQGVEGGSISMLSVQVG